MGITQEHIGTLHGQDVYDRSGDKIGSVGQVWADTAGQPSWISVNTGLFGLKESMLPLHNTSFEGDRLVTSYDKDLVKSAPSLDASSDEAFDNDTIGSLYSHYGLSWNDSSSSYAAGASATDTAFSSGERFDDSDSSSFSGGSSDSAMTRSEERLNVGVEREQVGKARLRKYVVTENVQTTVPVTREEVRIEREPITDANRDAALSGADISEAEHEVTLHAERPVVDTETVPVERVRLATDTVVEDETVSGEVRKERIETDLPDGSSNRRFS